MTASNRKTSESPQLTLGGNKPSTTELVEEFNVMENDKRRMEEWWDIFSDFSSHLGSLLSGRFGAFSQAESDEHLMQRNENRSNAAERHRTKSARVESQIIANETRALLRRSRSGQKRHNRKKTSSVKKKNSDCFSRVDGKHLSRIDGKQKHMQTRRKYHKEGSQKVRAENDRKSDMKDKIKRNEDRTLFARSTGTQMPNRFKTRRKDKLKKFGATTREDRSCVNNYDKQDRKKSHSPMRKLEVTRRFKNQDVTKSCRTHGVGRFCVNIEEILHMGLQISNDVIGVIRDVTEEVEMKALENPRMGVSKFSLR